eukprot:TRINITY_DN1704_c0_g1_i5.p1 TRINITY_DN1704_c0_g1~~TRINITY_DN1704_c0_g1_i5.p1  ORF type:complete len:224 (+),score=45.79 TRINITY_DN1704_c0_g1_i5:188-859(+)
MGCNTSTDLTIAIKNFKHDFIRRTERLEVDSADLNKRLAQLECKQVSEYYIEKHNSIVARASEQREGLLKRLETVSSKLSEVKTELNGKEAAVPSFVEGISTELPEFFLFPEGGDKKAAAAEGEDNTVDEETAAVNKPKLIALNAFAKHNKSLVTKNSSNNENFANGRKLRTLHTTDKLSKDVREANSSKELNRFLDDVRAGAKYRGSEKVLRINDIAIDVAG